MTTDIHDETVVAHEIELEPPMASSAAGNPVIGSVLPFIGAVKVQVSVRVGTSEASVSDLAEMRKGTVLTLDRLVEDPLDVLVDGHVVARGVLVAVGDHFGVRITEPANGATTHVARANARTAASPTSDATAANGQP